MARVIPKQGASGRPLVCFLVETPQILGFGIPKELEIRRHFLPYLAKHKF